MTPAEADRYAAVTRALETLAGAAATWPERPWLERDSVGLVPRVNLSVKVTALTPLMRPGSAPRPRRRRGTDASAAAARARARRAPARGHGVGRLARDDSRAGARGARGEFAAAIGRGRVAGLPARLPCAARSAARLGGGDRRAALVVRLVKAPTGTRRWSRPAARRLAPPVFERKADCDRNFELLTAACSTRALVRVKVGSHNLRSVAHAIATPAGRRRRRPRAPGAAWPRRRARRGPARGAWVLMLPSRRARRRDGLPGAAAARTPRTTRSCAPAHGAPVEELLAAP